MMVDIVALVIPNEFTINKIVDLGFDIATSLTIFGSIFLLYLTLNKERKRSLAEANRQRELGLDQTTRTNAADQLGRILTELSSLYHDILESIDNNDSEDMLKEKTRKFNQYLRASKYIIFPIFEIQVEKEYAKQLSNNPEFQKFKEDMDEFLEYCRDTYFEDMKKDDFEELYKKGRNVFRVRAYSKWLNDFVVSISKIDYLLIQRLHPNEESHPNEEPPPTRDEVNQLIWRVMTRVNGYFLKQLDLKSLMLYNNSHKRKFKDCIIRLNKKVKKFEGSGTGTREEEFFRDLKNQCECILASLSSSHHKMLANCEDRDFDNLFEYYKRAFKDTA